MSLPQDDSKQRQPDIRLAKAQLGCRPRRRALRCRSISLAVLADATASFRPSAYARERWGCALRFRFPIRKLLDLQARWDELEADPNPVALVVMAHLKAQESKDGPTRKGWKMRLVRLLYQRGYSREDILGPFRVLDWLL